MKKILLLLLVLATVFVFSSCNENGKNNESSNSQNFTFNTTEPTEPYKSKTFEKVFLKILSSQQKVEVTEELETQLLASKTANEIFLDENYRKMATIYVVYIGSTEKAEFGEIYTDSEDNMYIYAFENENKALYKVEDSIEITETLD